jgi:hypothetical protein
MKLEYGSSAFDHMTKGRLNSASLRHLLVESGASDMKKHSSHIDAVKVVYRDFVESVLKYMDIPSECERVKWENLYQLSDFDWKDWDKFRAYIELFN